MEPIKDQTKRCYTYNYIDRIVSTLAGGNLTYASENTYPKVLKWPFKTNLVPKKIRVVITATVDLSLAYGANATSQILQASNDSFYMTILGQYFQVSLNQRNEYEIDPHNWPSIQDYSMSPTALIQTDTTSTDNAFFFNAANAGGNQNFSASNQYTKIYVQLQIWE